MHENVKIIVDIPNLNNYGDISAGIGVAERMIAKGYDVGIWTPNDPQKTVESKIIQIYGRQYEPRIMQSDDWDYSGKYITISYNLDGTTYIQKLKTIAAIRLTEYDQKFGYCKCKKTLYENPNGPSQVPATSKIITINAGLSFKRPSEGAPNMQLGSGLFLSDEFEARLKQGMKRKALAMELIKRFELGENSSLGKFLLQHAQDSNWALFYPSGLPVQPAYFDILGEAENRLKNKLTVFSISGNNDNKKQVQNAAEKNKFSYCDARSKSRRDFSNEKVTVIELGILPNRIFQDLLMQADAPSVITGNHSLTQALQKIFSKNKTPASPILYQSAPWLQYTAKNLIQLLDAIDYEIAQDFSAYLQESQADYLYADFDSASKIKNLERLFYHEPYIKKYNSAFCELEQKIKEEIKNAGFKNEEVLFSNLDTIEYAVEQIIHQGKNPQEIYADFTA